MKQVYIYTDKHSNLSYILSLVFNVYLEWGHQVSQIGLELLRGSMVQASLKLCVPPASVTQEAGITVLGHQAHIKKFNLKTLGLLHSQIIKEV